MALLNRPLTDAECKALVRNSYAVVPASWDWLFEPRYQTVRYRACLDRVDYERLDTFYGLGPTSPSDSVWMVPRLP